jgi:hypothetical protein
LAHAGTFRLISSEIGRHKASSVQPLLPVACPLTAQCLKMSPLIHFVLVRGLA